MLLQHKVKISNDYLIILDFNLFFIKVKEILKDSAYS